MGIIWRPVARSRATNSVILSIFIRSNLNLHLVGLCNNFRVTYNFYPSVFSLRAVLLQFVTKYQFHIMCLLSFFRMNMSSSDPDYRNPIAMRLILPRLA